MLRKGLFKPKAIAFLRHETMDDKFVSQAPIKQELAQGSPEGLSHVPIALCWAPLLNASLIERFLGWFAFPSLNCNLVHCSNQLWQYQRKKTEFPDETSADSSGLPLQAQQLRLYALAHLYLAAEATSKISKGLNLDRSKITSKIISSATQKCSRHVERVLSHSSNIYFALDS